MRISCTLLETFRLWSQPEQEWMSEDALIASIRGEFVPTPAVKVGQAFGRIIEDPDRFLCPDGFYRCDGYALDEVTLEQVYPLIDRNGVFEAKATKDYGDCTVVAKADHLIGTHLNEFKTTLGYFDFDKYAKSVQWRFMADIFQPESISYHVFLLEEHGDQSLTIRGIESFNLYPYPDLHQDCCAMVEQFKAYVIGKGLDEPLRERQRAAA